MLRFIARRLVATVPVLVLVSLGVSVSGATERELRDLHARMRAGHEEWLAASGGGS